MLDVIGVLIPYLSETLGCEIFAEVPKSYPERFVTLERTGGSAEVYGLIDRPTLAMQCWAKTNHEAFTLASAVDAAMMQAPWHITNLMSAERNSLYNFPDPDSRMSRYQGIYELVTN